MHSISTLVMIVAQDGLQAVLDGQVATATPEYLMGFKVGACATDKADGAFNWFRVRDVSSLALGGSRLWYGVTLHL